MTQYNKQTLCVHSGTIIDPQDQGANSPIFTSTSFGYLDKETPMYPRYFNTKNQQALAEKISDLENGESALVFSSGMAAITSTLYSFLSQGDHIIFQSALYGGTLNFILKDLNRFGIEYTLVNSTYTEDFEQAIRENTRAIYIETPSNPLLKITNLEELARMAKSNNIFSIIDNTFASPVNQNPIDWWMDIVIHSATKYLNGHSDVTAGAVISTRHEIERIWETARNLGGSLNAQICYLLERSLKTLHIRVKAQNENAIQLAHFLEAHNKVQKVWYPGLKSHIGHETAKKQMNGFGGMLSFEPKNKSIIELQRKLKLIRPAVSLGGIDSTICSPAMTSHKGLTQEEREKQGISDTMLRLSVGIEDPDDLMQDLDQALESL
ncbi:MAG: aminotransferase class I/II-fold pyridoxal phosphate-dependent enzyme [Bacteroidales bacterium]|nr:aminotransferase class I/II-fold pyridoxal phosphate-dependent enzyme [Bacteroidales bacterium]